MSEPNTRAPVEGWIRCPDGTLTHKRARPLTHPRTNGHTKLMDIYLKATTKVPNTADTQIKFSEAVVHINWVTPSSLNKVTRVREVCNSNHGSPCSPFRECNVDTPADTVTPTLLRPLTYRVLLWKGLNPLFAHNTSCVVIYKLNNQRAPLRAFTKFVTSKQCN